MKTLTSFVNRNKIRISVEWADENKNAPEWRDANHFKITLRMGRKQLTTYFSQGYGISGEPDAKSVLDCLGSDAAGWENARSFEEWADEYGYDPDSRKAERIYRVVERQAKQLKRFLGDDLYEDLLWNTESL